MARARPIHSAKRAVGDLMVKAAKATKARDEWAQQLGLAEYDQQYQFPITGTASDAIGSTELQVDFDFPFHYAPGQRDSDLVEPHFTFGYRIDAPVMVGAGVKEWLIDANTGGYIGAVVWITVLAAGEGFDFIGRVHVTFQGFSAADDAQSTGLES